MHDESFLNEVQRELDRDRLPALRAQRRIGCAIAATIAIAVFFAAVAVIVAAILLAKVF